MFKALLSYVCTTLRCIIITTITINNSNRCYYTEVIYIILLPVFYSFFTLLPLRNIICFYPSQWNSASSPAPDWFRGSFGSVLRSPASGLLPPEQLKVRFHPELRPLQQRAPHRRLLVRLPTTICGCKPRLVLAPLSPSSKYALIPQHVHSPFLATAMATW